MDDDRTQGTNGGGEGPSRQEIADHLAAAMARLRAAVDGMRDEVEANAQAEWVRAKPELRSTVNELEEKVDALAERAKAALADLGARIDGERKEGAPQNDSSRGG